MFMMQIKKYIHIIFILLFATCSGAKFELQSLIPDKKSDDINLVSVSVDRIKEKQKLWENEFDNQQLKRWITYLGVALGIGGVSCAIVKPYIWQAPEVSTGSEIDSKNASDPESTKKPDLDSEEKAQKKYDRTFLGMLEKQTKNAAALALGSASVAFFSYIFSSSGAYLKTRLQRGFGFGESGVFAGLVREVLYNGEQLAGSLSSFIGVCESDKKNSTTSLKLRSCLSCGIAIDHYAFVMALEQWAAFTFEFLNQKNLSDEKKEEVFRSLVTLLGFFDDMVCCEKDMYSMYMSGEQQKSSTSHEEFVTSMKNFYQEVCRLSQRVGTLYYGTDFTLKNLRRC